MAVHGLVTLSGFVSTGPIDLAHTHFDNLVIIGFDPWLKHATGKVNLEGFSFDTLDIVDAKVQPRAFKMLDLLNSESCPFSLQAYLELEKFLRSYGNPEKADLTYIEMRRKERKQLPFWGRRFDWVVDKLVGYGKRPWMSGIYALLLIVVGSVVFQEKRMEHDDEKCTDTWYNPFWFSVDLLSPIDLGVSRRWRARASFLRNYAQLQRVAGWILIPFFVAAITGIIK